MIQTKIIVQDCAVAISTLGTIHGTIKCPKCFKNISIPMKMNMSDEVSFKFGPVTRHFNSYCAKDTKKQTQISISRITDFYKRASAEDGEDADNFLEQDNSEVENQLEQTGDDLDTGNDSEAEWLEDSNYFQEETVLYPGECNSEGELEGTPSSLLQTLQQFSQTQFHEHTAGEGNG